MPKAKEANAPTEKPIVNHRWQMPSLEDMVDQMVPEWPEGKHPDFSGPSGYLKMRRALLLFGDRLLSSVGMSMEKAAAKGIEQALRLIRDPEYTSTVRRRTKREIQRAEDNRKDWESRHERWKQCQFTMDEKIRELARLDQSIRYHEKELEQAKERRGKVQSATPTTFDTDLVDENVRPTFEPEKDDGHGDDEWPDRISFD